MNGSLLQNSLWVGVATAGIATSLGVMAAACFCGCSRQWRVSLAVVAMIALALPPFLVTNAWLHYLGHAGVWQNWAPVDLYSMAGVILVLSLMLWPVSFFLVAGAWQRLQPAQFESDPLLAGTALIRVLLWPAVRVALGQAAVLTGILALNNFAVPAMLQVKVFPAEIWVRFNTALDSAGAFKMSWPLIVVPLVALVWMVRNDIPWPRIQSAVPAPLFRRQLGWRWFLPAAAITALLAGLSAGLPLFQSFSAVRTWQELPGALSAGRGAVLDSVIAAGSAATLLVLLPLAFYAGRRAVCDPRHGRPSRLITALTWLPFLVPGVVLGLVLIALLNRPAFAFFYQSLAIVLFAFVIRYFAMAWHLLSRAAKSVDPALLDAARLEGAGKGHILALVYWPQMSRSIAGAWYIIFVLCLWDVETLLLVVPPGMETLSMRVFNLLHYGYASQVNAICLILLGLALAPLALWLVFQALPSGTFPGLGLRRFRAGFVLAVGAVALLGGTGCSPSLPAGQSALESSGVFQSVQIISKRGVGVGEVNKPRSVVLDAQDNFYVVDMTGRVQKFSPEGVFLLSWQMPESDKGRPKGLCRDQEGNIVVNEPHYSRVNFFSPQGKLVAQFGQHGTNAAQLAFPRAVAVNSANEIWVSEYGITERLQRFSAHGTHFLQAFGQMGDQPGQFNRPEGLCVDRQDRLYVADSCNHRIQVFSRDGVFLHQYGRAGQGLGELSYPYDICVDAEGRQFVCEFGNSRIQVFDAEFRPLEIIGGPGAAPGRFSNPWGVALDFRGNLYVADSQNHRVQKFIRRVPQVVLSAHS